MNNKGFTLIELLVVFVIIAIVGSIAVIGISAIRNNINENSFESKLEVILEGAKRYGEDNINSITNICSSLVDGDYCLDITIIDLLNHDSNYLTSDEVCDNSVCIINDVTKENINNNIITIYVKNNRVYAKYNG